MFQKPPLGIQINVGHPLARGLVGAWLMNEGAGGRVANVTNSGLGAGTVESLVWTPSKSGTTLYGTSSGSGIALPSSFQPLDGADEFTLIVRAKFETQIATDRGLFYSDLHAAGDGILFWADMIGGEGNKFAALLTNGYATQFGSTQPLPDTWYTCVLTLGGGYSRMYINGVEEGGNFPVATTGSIITSDTHYTIGNDSDGGKATSGWIEYCYIYNRDLSASEITELYRDPYGMFNIDPIDLFVAATSVGDSSSSSSVSSSSSDSSSSSVSLSSSSLVSSSSSSSVSSSSSQSSSSSSSVSSSSSQSSSSSSSESSSSSSSSESSSSSSKSSSSSSSESSSSSSSSESSSSSSESSSSSSESSSSSSSSESSSSSSESSSSSSSSGSSSSSSKSSSSSSSESSSSSSSSESSSSSSKSSSSSSSSFESSSSSSESSSSSVSIKDYSRGDLDILPVNNNNDLENIFTSTEYDHVDTDNGVRVAQAATDENAIFLFKDKHTNNTDAITFNWNGKTDRSPSLSTVYLQIFNRVTGGGQWETLDSDSTTGVDIDFTLTGTQSSDLSNYYDASFWVSARVYQEAT